VDGVDGGDDDVYANGEPRREEGGVILVEREGLSVRPLRMPSRCTTLSHIVQSIAHRLQLSVLSKRPAVPILLVSAVGVSDSRRNGSEIMQTAQQRGGKCLQLKRQHSFFCVTEIKLAS